MVGDTLRRRWSTLRARAALLAAVLAACGPEPAPADGGPARDAPSLDAPGLDATTADAPATPDAPGADAGPPRCDDPDRDGDGRDAITCGGDDCDDDDPERAPGRLEVCDAAGRDEDCDPTTLGARDADGDGLTDAACCNTRPDGLRACGPDCDDLRRGVFPGATEVCNRADDDCDGTLDEGVLVDGFADEDRDLHGDPLVARQGCPGTPGLSVLADDCDDTDPTIHPAQREICNGLDDDCDGATDDGASAVPWWLDADRDGFGDPGSTPVSSCFPIAGRSTLPSDCDDADPGTSPRAPERCNARDDDCDGRADFEVTPGDLEDDDRDGSPDAACAPAGDCDDRDPLTRPGAPELVDGRDNDCDGSVDGACENRAWLPDADGDGWGDTSRPAVFACEPVDGRAGRGGDCDDADPGRSPSEPDDCDGVDDDCDGRVDEEAPRYCLLAHAVPVCAAGACAVAVCNSGVGRLRRPGLDRVRGAPPQRRDELRRLRQALSGRPAWPRGVPRGGVRPRLRHGLRRLRRRRGERLRDRRLRRSGQLRQLRPPLQRPLARLGRLRRGQLCARMRAGLGELRWGRRQRLRGARRARAGRVRRVRRPVPDRG